MKTRKIPSNQDPWIVDIGGARYVFKAGETVSVPDEIAAIIDQIAAAEPVTDDPTVRVVNEIGDAPTDKQVPTSKAAKEYVKEYVGEQIPYFFEYSNSTHAAKASIDDIVEMYNRGRMVCAFLPGSDNGAVLTMDHKVTAGQSGYTVMFSGIRGNKSYGLIGSQRRGFPDSWSLIVQLLDRVADGVEDATSETVVDTVNALIAALVSAGLMTEYVPPVDAE